MTLRRCLPFVRMLVSIAALVLLLTLFDFREIVVTIAKVRWEAFFAAEMAFVITTAVFVVKWNLTLPASVGIVQTARGYFASYFYSLLPAGQMGAELGKVMTLAGHADVSLLTGSVVFDKLVGLLALAGIGVAAWCLVPASPWMLALTLCVVAGCVLALAYAPYASRLLPCRRNTAPASFQRLREKVLRLSGPVERWVADRKLLAMVLALGLLGQACMVAVYVIVARALGLDLALAQFALLVVIANLATLVPVSLGGVGVREASMTGLLAAQGIPVASAIALSLIVFTVFLLGAAVGGALEFHDLMRAFRRFMANRSSAAAETARRKGP